MILNYKDYRYSNCIMNDVKFVPFHNVETKFNYKF